MATNGRFASRRGPASLLALACCYRLAGLQRFKKKRIMNKTENEKLICDKCEGECGHREHCKYENDFESDDDEYSSCKKCGGDSIWEQCWSCGGEGGTDGEELMMEDPFWYSEDDYRMCDICEGKGGYYICLNTKCKDED